MFKNLPTEGTICTYGRAKLLWNWSWVNISFSILGTDYHGQIIVGVQNICYKCSITIADLSTVGLRVL